MKLIKFYTTWCGPCKTVSMLLDQVDLTGVELVRVDAEVELELVEKYKITGVPVLVFETGGVEITRLNGVASPETIEKILNGM